MTEYPITTFSRHYRRRYGKSIGKIALDLGFPCPNRRQNGGCTYCSPVSYTPFYLDMNDTIAEQLAKGKNNLPKKKFRAYFAYFQQETTTAAPREILAESFRMPFADPDCIGLIIATRPDSISPETYADLRQIRKDFPTKEILLELGLQSAHNRTLQKINRNHRWQDFLLATEKIHRISGIQIGAHVIFGLPGETEDDMGQTVDKAVQAGVDYLKLHHLQIIKGSKMAACFSVNPIPLFTPEHYLDLLARLLARIPARIVIHRLWSRSPPDVLIGPKWDKTPSELKAMLINSMTHQGLYQGKFSDR